MTPLQLPQPIQAFLLRVMPLLLALGVVLSLNKALIMAPAVSIAAVIVLATFGRTLFPLPCSRSVGILLTLGLVWTGATAAWSLDPAFSLSAWPMLAGAALAGLVLWAGFLRLSDVQWRRLVLALGWALLGTAVFIAIVGLTHRIGMRVLPSPQVGHFDAWLGPRLQSLNRAVIVLAILLWPMVSALISLGRRRHAVLLAMFMVPAIFCSFDLAAKLVLIAGALTWGVARIHRKAVIAVLAFISVVVVIGAPWATRLIPPPQISIEWPGMVSSAHHRLTIWSFVGEKIAEKPVLGWGLESARAIPGGKDKVLVAKTRGCDGVLDMVQVPDARIAVPRDCLLLEEKLPLHPHDAWLQVWLETGAVGAVLVAGLLLAVLAGVWRTDDQAAPMALATYVAAFIIASVAFGAWQSWWLCSLWLAVALAGRLRADSRV